MVCFIDEYGIIVEEKDSKYTVTLDGSYEWSFFSKGWWYGIKEITPKINITYIFSKVKLL